MEASFSTESHSHSRNVAQKWPSTKTAGHPAVILMMGVTQQESVVVKEMGQAATFVTYAVCLGFIRKLRSPPVSRGQR